MIRKSLSVVLLSILGLSASYAQSGLSGFPWSFNQNVEVVPTEKYEFPATDNSALMDATKPGPYMVASTFDVDLSFPESGVLTRLENGSYIWSITLKVNEAKGIGTYFNSFNLPKGVSLYLFNQNKRHVKGPITADDNNLETNKFAIGAIQGDVMTLELNIEPGVDFNKIDMSIRALASYFRGVSDLEYYTDDYRYGTIDEWDEGAFASSSKCMINANCSQSMGFELPKNATVKEIIRVEEGIGYCTGTFVNNTGNTEDNCTRYLLTATHCEGDNATASGEYWDEWILKLNYQTPGCEMTDIAPVSNEKVGVEFVSRDPYDDDAPASELDADFLLLKFNGSMPSSWNVMLAGWDNNSGHVTAYPPSKKFMFFHHPNGDIKKLSSTRSLENADDAIYATQYLEGFGAPGSSGSGMFDNDLRLIGIASTAIYGEAPDSCYYSHRGIFEAENTSNVLFYAKFSYCWENPSLSSPTDAQRLKPWLDPTGSGASQIDGVNWRCESLSIDSDLGSSFDGALNIYPNPSTDGSFQMNIRMNQASYAQVQVYDITGKTILSKDLGKLQSQIVNLDLTQFTSGMYMVRISNQYGQITKKVVINK